MSDNDSVLDTEEETLEKYAKKTEEGSRNDIKISWDCSLCSRNIKVGLSSNGNIKRHLENKHHIKLIKHKKRKLTVNQRIVNYVVSANAPLAMVENKRFQELFGDTIKKDRIQTAATLRDAIQDRAEEYRTQLKTVFEDIPAIALTADAWTSYNKSYMGVTAAWYDTHLRRQAAILAIRRVVGSLTYDVIRQQLIDIMELYNIRNKTVSITTDNGSNFVKCMIIYGENNENTLEDEDIDIQVVEIDDLNVEDEPALPFPKHIRCAAHRLNLVAKAFITKFDKSSEFYRKYMDIMARCRKIWSHQSKSSKVSDIIRKICGSLFILPSMTRWNALVDAFKDIFKKRKHLKNITDALGIDGFTEDDMTFLRHFIRIMNPVALGIDQLQSDDEPYGMLFLTITSIKKKLDIMATDKIYDEEYAMMKPLINLLRTEIETRFSDISLDEKLAAALSPECLKKDSALKDYGLTHILHLKSKCGEEINSTGNQQDSWDSPLFPEEALSHDCGIPEFYTGHKVQEDLHKYPCVKKLFVIYNTPLPTSAAVERAFSSCRRVMTFDRSRLGDELFEALTILRAGLELDVDV